MEQRQILELALKELERRKTGIDADIEAIRTELRGTGSAVQQAVPTPSAGTQRGRKRTPAERRAQAQRMREIWKKRKAAAAAKPAAPAKTAPAAASTKTRSLTAAQRKTISLKMKEAWKKRRAAAEKGK